MYTVKLPMVFTPLTYLRDKIRCELGQVWYIQCIYGVYTYIVYIYDRLRYVYLLLLYI